MEDQFIRGRGAQFNTANRFGRYDTVMEHLEGLDEPLLQEVETKVFIDTPSKIVNKVESSDVGMMYSVNPYQGCEHGCIYCYARNSHEYWGFSAGLDFESRLIAKPNAAKLLAEHFDRASWRPQVISLSGNTDCYQPIERKYRITRSLLEVCLRYKNPVGIITKNMLVLRDKDLLRELAQLKLVQVWVTITATDEEIRRKLEPRTTTYANRLRIISELTELGVPCGVMVAPVIPGLTNYEINKVIKAAAKAGAYSAGYTILRLNGAIGKLFTDWILKAYPDRAEKVLKQVAACHGGQVNDSRFGTRMKGEGKIAESIRNLFHTSRNKYMSGVPQYAPDLSLFQRPLKKGEQMKLF